LQGLNDLVSRPQYLAATSAVTSSERCKARSYRNLRRTGPLWCWKPLRSLKVRAAWALPACLLLTILVMFIPLSFHYACVSVKTYIAQGGSCVLYCIHLCLSSVNLSRRMQQLLRGHSLVFKY
jgi:hypothetical protein